MHSLKISSLSLDEKIGQLFFVGLPNDHLDEQARTIMETVKPGGVCLFARNIKEPRQVRILLDELRDRSAVEPLLSIDQEGGLVDRLRRILGPMPAASRLDSPKSATAQGQIIGEALRLLGFNMDFAPVVDVVDGRRSAFTNGLHSRTYGSSAADVVSIASAFADALHAAGIIGCLKHFPGLGASEVDSHEELPKVEVGAEDLRSIDLVPYKHLIDSGIARAVMVAHAAYPRLDLQETDRDGKLLPSSLSFNVVTKLLRNELGFDGLVLTDDLEMGAIMKTYGVAEASLMAIEAGNDMVAICAGVDSILQAHEMLCSAVRDGSISLERLDRSVQRVLDLKMQMTVPHELELDQITSLSRRIVELNGSLS